MFKDYLNKIYLEACNQNIQNIDQALTMTGPHKVLIDIGCWDGKWTIHFAHIAHAQKILGIEPSSMVAKKAAAKGISVFTMPADQNKWPIPDTSIDCIVSNQVVEHLINLDGYFQEASRVLKPGGIIITSTNNLSSLHNILAICLGWAPFDLTNSSVKASGIGNPYSLHKHAATSNNSSWIHKCIYTSYWLNEWQRIYGLHPLKTYGAGLYPFPAFWGRIFKKYAAFITVINQK
jgi:SAM-dependent methyltransferase